MKEIADRNGVAAKFPGSGGAMVGICLDSDKMIALKHDFEKHGFVFSVLRPNIDGGNMEVGK